MNTRKPSFLHQGKPVPPKAAHPPVPPEALPSDMLDHAQMGFGKYATKTPAEVADLDPAYLVWAYTNVKRPVCSPALYRVALEEAAEKEKSFQQFKKQWGLETKDGNWGDII